MGRHANGRSAAKSRIFRVVPALFGLLALAVVVVLGLWWWNLRDTADPIDADPQRAYAVVQSSGPCAEADAATAVEFTVAGQTVNTSLAGCGFKVGQRLAIQYLNGHPEQIRLVGVSATPASSTAKRLLPLVILGIGFIAAAAAVALMRENRQGRRRLAGAKDTVTVAQMREAVLADRALDRPVVDRSDSTNAVASHSAPLTPPASGPQLTKSLPANAGAQRSVTVIRVTQQPESEEDIFGPGTN